MSDSGDKALEECGRGEVVKPMPRCWPLAQWLLWSGLALLVTWPMALFLPRFLIGDPRIDVWNHAWGYWWVAECLKEGVFPNHTQLLGGPVGGALYYVDLLGALLATPLTWLAGPAVAYNLTLMARVALAGFAGERLCRELTGPGAKATLAGTFAATTPYLLSEMRNGITEVCNTHWFIFTLWATSRALKHHRWRDWGLLGLFQGLTFLSNFYYGFLSGFLVGFWIFLSVAARIVAYFIGKRANTRAESPTSRPRMPASSAKALGLPLLSLLVAALIMVPAWKVFSDSVHSPDSLIRRTNQVHHELVKHNAVDPRVYVHPGDFQSVDLMREYGEHLRHTGYFRLSLLFLALLALVRVKNVRLIGCVGGLSLVLGLGNHLFYGGDFVRYQGRALSLPFQWLLNVLPNVTISHPLRLSLGAQVVVCVLAGVGAGELVSRVKSRNTRAGLTLLLGLMGVGETLFASSALWPLPASRAEVADFYRRAPEGMVVEFPAEVGTTMLSSSYLWHQTVHRRPIPYTPDARAGSARDQTIFEELRTHREGAMDRPVPPSEAWVAHLKQHYGMLVVNRDLERAGHMTSSYEEAFRGVLGEPEVFGSSYVWFLHQKSGGPATEGNVPQVPSR